MDGLLATSPNSLTAVLLPDAQVHGTLALLGADTLLIAEDLPGSDAWPLEQPLNLLLVPDAAASNRRHLLRLLAGRQAVVSPPRPWTEASSSYDRAARTLELVGCSEPRVHPQPVRYRMDQLREAYGARLEDPRFVRELVVAMPSRS